MNQQKKNSQAANILQVHEVKRWDETCECAELVAYLLPTSHETTKIKQVCAKRGNNMYPHSNWVHFVRRLLQHHASQDDTNKLLCVGKKHRLISCFHSVMNQSDTHSCSQRSSTQQRHNIFRRKHQSVFFLFYSPCLQKDSWTVCKLVPKRQNWDEKWIKARNTEENSSRGINTEKSVKREEDKPHPGGEGPSKVEKLWQPRDQNEEEGAERRFKEVKRRKLVLFLSSSG